MEPKRISDINKLQSYLIPRVQAILAEMRVLGFDPILFETLRTIERQRWLYGIGRTHSKKRKPVTWTMHSKHINGKAADIISKSRGWDWKEFFDALDMVSQRYNMHTLNVERCHIEWRG